MRTLPAVHPTPNSCEIEVVDDARTAQRLRCRRGASLLEGLLDAGLLVRTACGGHGRCRLCRVRLLAGSEAAPVPTAIERRALLAEDLEAGVRLSCQVRVQRPLRLQLLAWT